MNRIGLASTCSRANALISLSHNLGKKIKYMYKILNKHKTNDIYLDTMTQGSRKLTHLEKKYIMQQKIAGIASMYLLWPAYLMSVLWRDKKYFQVLYLINEYINIDLTSLNAVSLYSFLSFS